MRAYLLFLTRPVLTISKYHEGVKEAKKKRIAKAIGEANGNLSEATKLLGVNLTYLYRLIRNLNLKETNRTQLRS